MSEEKTDLPKPISTCAETNGGRFELSSHSCQKTGNENIIFKSYIQDFYFNVKKKNVPTFLNVLL